LTRTPARKSNKGVRPLKVNSKGSDPFFSAVVFDMDGLILDTEPLYKHAWQHAAAELGHALTDSLYAPLIGRNDADSMAYLRQLFGSDFPVRHFTGLWQARWHSAGVASGIAVKPGFAALKRYLDEAGVPSAIATSSGRAQALASLQMAGLAECFDIIVAGDEVSNGKPAPDIYLRAAAALATPAPRCIALEDSEAGLRAAVAAGMTALLVPDLRSPSPEARSHACHVLGSLEEALPIIAALLRRSPSGDI